MFQLDPGFSAAALDEFVADVTAPVADSKPAIDGSGLVAWEDDEYYYVFDE